jgi:imidazolonepropionase-like amidohydrolase
MREKIFFINTVLFCLLLTVTLWGFAPAMAGSIPGNGNLALINATIFDGTGNVIQNGILLVKGNLIEKVGTAKDLKVPEGYQQIDLHGLMVLPGFINAHVHRAYDEAALKNWLVSGVTTVRDLGVFGIDNFTQRRDQLNKDPLNARLVSATPIITTKGGYGGAYVSSAEDAINKVNDFIKMKVDIIKIAIEDDLQGRVWPMLSLTEIKSITGAAHLQGKKVAAHVSHVRNLRLAIDGGVDEISHMVVEELDQNLIEEIIKANIYWVPTLELWQGVSKIHGLNWDKIAFSNLGKFYKAGGKIALGTDFAGYICSFDKGLPITEIRLMQQAGMSNSDIIIAATRNAAYVSGLDKELGTLENGKIADIIAVEGNPLQNIESLQEIRFVIHNGRIVYQK